MLIISKFHDYYDNINSLGIDKTVVYNRTTSEMVVPKEIKKYFQGLLNEFREVNLDRYSNTKDAEIILNIIGFCGRIYPFFTMRQFKEREKEEISREYGFETADVLKFIKNKRLEDVARSGFRKKYYWQQQRAKLSKTNLDYFFKKLDGRQIKDEPFFEMKSPVFCYQGPIFTAPWSFRDESKMIVNPSLSDFGFYKKIDSFTAFQEIYMYLSGVLGIDQKETIEIKDQDMLIKKGFDSKSSFRHPVK